MESQTIPHGFNLRSGKQIAAKPYEMLGQIIEELLHRTQARFVLVTDVSGQIVAMRGNYEGLDLVVLGALVAGDLAASQEIARIMGTAQDYQLVTREGHLSHAFIAEAGSHFVLFIQVGTDIPIGWARIRTRQAAEQLAQIEVQEAEHLPGMVATELLQNDSSLDLSDLFGEALDDLWQE